MAKKRSRKRRGKPPKPRQRQLQASAQATMERGYARSRQKDEEARAKLKPLERSERPTAVTVGAIVATLLCLANVVALIAGYSPDDEAQRPALTIFGALILALVAYGMWRARYWAVLGMQTLLALAIIGSALALITAANALAVALTVAIILLAGTLFWFLIKAMARIQMPERPGTRG